jgi:hypothetical protein
MMMALALAGALVSTAGLAAPPPGPRAGDRRRARLRRPRRRGRGRPELPRIYDRRRHRLHPGPVKAKAVYGRPAAGRTPKEGGTLLAWWPNCAGIARSGDLGFSTGPAESTASAFRIYFTVWQQPGRRRLEVGLRRRRGKRSDPGAGARRAGQGAGRGRRAATQPGEGDGAGGPRSKRPWPPGRTPMSRRPTGRARRRRTPAGLEAGAGDHARRRRQGAGDPGQGDRFRPLGGDGVQAGDPRPGPTATRAGPAAAATMCGSGSVAAAPGSSSSTRSWRAASPSPVRAALPRWRAAGPRRTRRVRAG